MSYNTKRRLRSLLHCTRKQLVHMVNSSPDWWFDTTTMDKYEIAQEIVNRNRVAYDAIKEV